MGHKRKLSVPVNLDIPDIVVLGDKCEALVGNKVIDCRASIGNIRMDTSEYENLPIIVYPAAAVDWGLVLFIKVSRNRL